MERETGKWGPSLDIKNDDSFLHNKMRRNKQLFNLFAQIQFSIQGKTIMNVGRVQFCVCGMLVKKKSIIKKMALAISLCVTARYEAVSG